MTIEDLTVGNFDAAIADGITVVDFWASWCGPCKMMAPVIEKFAEGANGNTKVCKVNVDNEQELAMRYGVMSIPTIIAFKDGKILNQLVGVQPIEALEKLIS